MRRTVLFFVSFLGIVISVLALLYWAEQSTARDVAISAGITVLALFAAATLTAEAERTRVRGGWQNTSEKAGASVEPPRTIEGWFWFPPVGERSFGTIEISPRDLSLRVRDSTRPQHAWRDMAVIHGESLDGKDLTLLGAVVTTRQDFISYDHNLEQFRFNMLLIGAHVIEESELVFARGVLHLRGLREWMSASWRGQAPYAFRDLVAPPPRGLRERFAAWRETHRRRADIAALPHPLEVALPSATLKLGYERSVGGTRFQQVTDYDAAVDVELDEARPLDEWLEQWVRPLLDLLVFATREQIVVEGFTAIIYERRLPELVHPVIRRAARDRVRARHHIEVVRPHVVDVRARGIRPFQHMLLPLGALGRRAPTALAEYFRIYRALGRTAAFFFVVLNARTIHEENRLLNLMAFSEGYHRAFHDDPPLAEDVHRQQIDNMLAAIDKEYRPVYDSPLNYANQQTQRQRLKFLISRAGSVVPSLADPQNILRNALVETRNQYTHQGEPASNVIPDADLYEHVERFIEVLEVNLLLDLGLDANETRALNATAHPS